MKKIAFSLVLSAFIAAPAFAAEPAPAQPTEHKKEEKKQDKKETKKEEKKDEKAEEKK